MKIFVALIFLVLMPWHAIAQTGAPKPSVQPMPLEDQERIDQMEKVIDKLNDLQATVEQATAAKKRGCVKAIGNETFCNCIIESIPVVMEFPQCVFILGATKDELHYDTLSPDDKKAIDMARTSRDKCVNAQAAMKVLPTKK